MTTPSRGRGRVEQDAEHLLRILVEGVASDTGEAFFSALVTSLARALDVRHGFIGEVAVGPARARTLAYWGDGRLRDDFEYEIAGTPCEEVLAGRVTHYGCDLQAAFPSDRLLVEWEAESYLGVPLLGADDEVLGHLAVLDDRPMPAEPAVEWVMQIFAARARAELERLRAERDLRASEQRLARVLDTAMDAIVTVDDQLRVVLFNEAAERVLRCSGPDVEGRPLDPFLTPALRDALTGELDELAANPESRPCRWLPDGLTARRADGQEFHIEATLSHVLAGGERLTTIIMRDVDDRLEAERALRRLEHQQAYLLEEIKTHADFDEIVGRSSALEEVLRSVDLVAPTDTPVLITGESGTGKELIARALHAHGRRDRPLIKVNCAALSAGLIESELFGHVRGAFTGAVTERIGRFELAQEGTIFLDEIGELPPEVQVKLLRVLQERELERVGGTTTIRLDVRVIAASNRDLAAAVADGQFRADLFYRLNAFPVHVPPLRERRDDIPLLVHYFAHRAASRIGRRIERIGGDSMRRLIGYAWPGNVRELANVVERCVILAAGPDLDVPAALLPDVRSVSAPAVVAIDAPTLEQVERDHIATMLGRSAWVIEGPHGAALALGLHPNTLRSRMKRLGLHRPAPTTGPA